MDHKTSTLQGLSSVPSETYSIMLYQTTGEIQTQWTSDSKEEIMKLWEMEKNQQDEFTEMDDYLVLYEDDEWIEDYTITDEQRE